MGFFKKLFRRATESKQDKVQRNLNQEACEAAYDNNFKLALELLAQGASPNYIGTHKEYDYDSSYTVACTLSYSAVKHNNDKAMMALIERGLNVNISLDTKEQKPLLMHTIEDKKEQLAMMLVEYGADLNYTRRDLETCQSLAQKYGMNALLEKMEARVNPSVEAQQPVTPMKTIQLKKQPGAAV